MKLATLTTALVLALATVTMAQDATYDFRGTLEDGVTEFTGSVTIAMPLPADQNAADNIAQHTSGTTRICDWELTIGSETYRRDSAAFRNDGVYVIDGATPSPDKLFFFANDTYSFSLTLTNLAGTAFTGDAFPADVDATAWDEGQMSFTDWSDLGSPVISAGSLDWVSPGMTGDGSADTDTTYTSGEGEPTVVEPVDGRGRATLDRAPDSPETRSRGRISVRSKNGNDKLKIKVSRLKSTDSAIFLMGDGDGGYDEIGRIRASSSAELVFDTKRGDTLPGGVSWVGELAGRPVQVVSEDGTVLFTGIVPAIDGNCVEAKLKIESKSKDWEASIELKYLGSDTAYELWIETSDGELTRAFSFESDSSGKFKQELKSKYGGVFFDLFPDAEDLANRAFEVRGAAGTVVFSGRFPALEDKSDKHGKGCSKDDNEDENKGDD